MEYTLLGRTGVRVSRLALGTATFGVAPQEHEAIELVRWRTDEIEGRLNEIEDAKTVIGLLLYLRRVTAPG